MGAIDAQEKALFIAPIFKVIGAQLQKVCPNMPKYAQMARTFHTHAKFGHKPVLCQHSGTNDRENGCN